MSKSPDFRIVEKTVIRTVHPFPARMAPDLAIQGLKNLHHCGVVLDPMIGSGTVMRHASELGHRAIGFDMDPLAILMTKVSTTPIEDDIISKMATDVVSQATSLRGDFDLPWIDQDEETRDFINYWFAEPQRSDLRRLAHLLSQMTSQNLNDQMLVAADVLRISLSRIIITKEQGASLARDVSHSRPHKVAESSNFAVIPAFERSVKQVRHLLVNKPPTGNVRVMLGDARSLSSVEDGEVDIIITSPPYLNAIDYMRGHRLSLVWLGHRLGDLRVIRSNSIGAERGPNTVNFDQSFDAIRNAMAPSDMLLKRHASMVLRYSEDLYYLMYEVSRVLNSTGEATLVVGNSCLKGCFIQNSEGVARAASLVGLRLLRKVERELPSQYRYLPTPSDAHTPLGRRMKTEAVLTFTHA
jgi:hypothetical protein